MELVIGGFGQGKLNYILQEHKELKWAIYDETQRKNLYTRKEENIIIYHFHLWIKEILEEGKEPEAFVEELMNHFPDCIVICDEIGNGIVPIDQAERRYREQVGKSLIKLAEKAKRVDRVICGLGQRIK